MYLTILALPLLGAISAGFFVGKIQGVISVQSVDPYIFGACLPGSDCNYDWDNRNRSFRPLYCYVLIKKLLLPGTFHGCLRR